MVSLQSFVAFVSLLLLIFLPGFQSTSSNRNSTFSLKLIHRFSPESPLYPGPMTLQERVEWYMRISESRVSSLKPTNIHNKTVKPNMMRAPVMSDSFVYIVEIEFGTPLKKFYLMLDTGSGLTWMQCKPCKECVYQRYDIYDPSLSTTFKKIPCNSPLCRGFTCSNEQCTYTIGYLDGSSSQGYAALDTFHMRDEHGVYTHLGDHLFGCSNLNKNLKIGSSGVIAGIMGLDMNPNSFITQLGSFIKRRFSYCLVDPFSPGKSKVSSLKFGLTDIGYIGGNVQQTPFVKHPKSYAYYLNLLDISVNNNRLNLPPDTFKIGDGGEGGFIIDSGSVITYLIKPAYTKLEDEIVRYFSAFKQVMRSLTCPPPTRLCYYAQTALPLFPSITYHFEGANLTIAPENSFIKIANKSFAMAIVPSIGESILGSIQQHDTRFVFSMESNTLAFVRDDCSQDQP